MNNSIKLCFMPKKIPRSFKKFGGYQVYFFESSAIASLRWVARNRYCHLVLLYLSRRGLRQRREKAPRIFSGDYTPALACICLSKKYWLGHKANLICANSLTLPRLFPEKRFAVSFPATVLGNSSAVSKDSGHVVLPV